MWDWSSTDIDFSQTCWTFDGYNGCTKRRGGRGQFGDKAWEIGQERIKLEDEEIINFIVSMVTKGIL